MIKVVINDKQQYLVKEKWEELTPVETVRVFAVLMGEFKTPEAQKMAMFFALSGEEPERFARLIGGIENDYALLQIVEELLPLMDYFLQDPVFTKNLVPEFDAGGIMYRGPADRMANQTGQEMILSHHAMAMYKSGAPGSEKYLDLIIAINYHPLVGGKRTVLAEEQLQEHVNRIAGISPVIKHYILLWMDNCENEWQKRYPWLFSQAEEQSETDSPVDGEAWRKIMFGLADNSLGDAWDKVRGRARQDIFFALDELEQIREKNDVE